MTDRELMQRALDAMLNNPDDISDEMFEAIRALKARLAQPDQEPRQWQGLSPFDKTLLRTTYALMKPLYYDKENDHSVCAEVVTDWDSFFAAIESKLQERNP